MRTLTVWTMGVAAALVLSGAAEAQPLGTFRWQLLPYCNVVTVGVIHSGGSYTLDGYDDQCGAAPRAPLVGLATPNPDGTIVLGFNIVAAPSGEGVQVAAIITLATLGGTWRDSAGTAGTFTFLTGPPAAGSPRPAVTPVTYGSALVQPAGASDRGFSVRTNSDPGPITGDAAAVYGQFGTGSGWGSPGSAGVRGDSASGSGVVGTSSTGSGTAGISTSGFGVYAFTNTGTALIARSTGGTTALEINNGDITVSGTVRPAFQHTATAGNISSYITTIDHPLTNGDPDAMLFITHVYNAGAFVYEPNPTSVWYDTGISRWRIYHDNLAAMAVNTRFNVLVIKQ